MQGGTNRVNRASLKCHVAKISPDGTYVKPRMSDYHYTVINIPVQYSTYAQTTQFNFVLCFALILTVSLRIEHAKYKITKNYHLR